MDIGWTNCLGYLFFFIQIFVPMALQQTTNCRTCAQDVGACREVRGTFGVTVMSRGYNPVVTIPAGACNINITEREYSGNFLALKTSSGKYVINGLWSMNSPGEFDEVGTVFTYSRRTDQCPGECIRSPGASLEDIIVQVLYEYTNPGIDYSYQLPANIAGKSQSQIREHHRVHRHRHDKHTRPLGDPEQTQIDAMKTEQPIPSTTKASHLRSPQSIRRSSHRRGPIFSSDFSRGRSRAHRHRRPHHRRQPLTDVISNRRRQSLTDVTYSRPAPSGDRYNIERPDYAAGLEPAVSKVDVQLQYGTLNSTSIYSWKVSGFSECTKSCGGGVHETVVVCVLTASQTIVSDDNCDVTTKPENQHANCNTGLCPAEWDTDSWSDCSVTCGLGQQTRNVVCKQRISATRSVSMSDDNCVDRQPAMVRQCQADPCMRWVSGAWGQCSVDCGEGVRRRRVTCLDPEGRNLDDDQCDLNKPRSEESCDMGSCSRHWFFSKWQDQCSSDCGSGVMSRHVHCAADSGEQQPSEQCDVNKKPRSEKQCQQYIPCGGKWFAGPWSECSVSCGVGVKSRDVVCLRTVNGQSPTIVSDESCVETEKPANSEVCNHDDCGTQWYMSSWSTCSVTCGGGVKTRYVRCLDQDMTPSTTCAEGERPPDVMRCNTERCWRGLPQPASGCRDRFPNCRVVVQARLCRYSYYQRKCCASCSQGYK